MIGQTLLSDPDPYGQDETVLWTVHTVPPHKVMSVSRPIPSGTGQDSPMDMLYHLTSHVYVSVPSHVGQPIDSS